MKDLILDSFKNALIEASIQVLQDSKKKTPPPPQKKTPAKKSGGSTGGTSDKCKKKGKK